MPMVWYIPPLSPVVDVAARHRPRRRGRRQPVRRRSTRCASRSSTSPSCSPPATRRRSTRCCAGSPRCAPTCATSTSAASPTSRSPTPVGMTGEQMDDMYRLLAIAKYDERYVIPPAHAEQAHQPGGAGHRVQPRLRGRPGHGRLRAVRRGAPAAPAPIAVENFHMLRDRQTADTVVDPGDKARRVNLLNWDGKGAPDGPVPAAPDADAGRQRDAGRADARADDRDGAPRAWQAASLLLGYPDDELLGRAGRCCAAVADALPGAGRRRRCGAFLDHLDAHRRCRRWPADYVETFDLRRRCCLYLTYYTHGDTRKRGMALLRVQARLPRPPGWSSPTASCPTTCRRAASSPPPATRRAAGALLREHRAGLELLRLALARRRLAVRATCSTRSRATLPPLRRRRPRRRRPRWPRSGPPEEEVGLGSRSRPPEYMPGGRRGWRADDTRILLWVVVPYSAIAVFVVGHVWRYRYDKFGWTTRSSQLYETPAAALGQPAVPLRHPARARSGTSAGLVIPKSWTEAVGITEHAYHADGRRSRHRRRRLHAGRRWRILIYRRRTVGPVFSATTRNDKAMYVVLAGDDRARPAAPPCSANIAGDGYDYRETVSPWFRSHLLPPARPGADGRRAARLPAARRSPRSRCSRSGRSPGSCTCSARRSATSPARTSSTAAATPGSAAAPPAAAGSASADESGASGMSAQCGCRLSAGCRRRSGWAGRAG